MGIEDAERLFRRGKMNLHAKKETVPNSALSRGDYLRYTASINTLKYLHESFAKIIPIYRKNIHGQGSIQTMRPSTPYGYGSVMVTAFDESVGIGPTESHDGGEQISTTSIYDFPTESQVEYFRQTIACLRAEGSTKFPEEQTESTYEAPHVLAVENANISISTESYRLPRSIALPHIRIIRSGDWFDPEHHPRRGFGFRAEQKILRDSGLFEESSKYYKKLIETECPEFLNRLQISQRDELPLGYTIKTDLSPLQSISEQASVISRLLEIHHRAYEQFFKLTTERVDELKTHDHQEGLPLVENRTTTLERLVPQPSYRMYLYYKNDKLCATISPQIFAAVGAIETMGITIHRSPKHPDPHSEQENLQFEQEFSNNLKELLNSE